MDRLSPNRSASCQPRLLRAGLPHAHLEHVHAALGLRQRFVLRRGVRADGGVFRIAGADQPVELAVLRFVVLDRAVVCRLRVVGSCLRAPQLHGQVADDDQLD